MATLGKSAPRAQRPSTDTLDYRGLNQGLQAVAQGVADYGAVLDKGDQRRAAEAMASVREQFDPAFNTAVATYDGQTPGFASAQAKAYDDHVELARQGLTPTQQRYFDQTNLEQRLRVLDQASGVEAQAQGAHLRQVRAADQNSRIIRLTGDFQQQTKTALRAAFVEADPTAPDFLPSRLADFDQRAAEVMKGVSPEDAPLVKLQLENQRRDLQNVAADTARGLLDARIVDNTRQTVSLLINSVREDPGELTAALAKIPAAVSQLPADLRQKMGAALPGDMIASALDGLESREDYYGMEALLADKRTKALLAPPQFAAMQARVTTAATSQKRQLAAQTVNDRFQAELASIASTGQSTGFDPASLISVYGPVDGPAKVAAARQSIEDAKTVRQATYDFAALTPKDQAARLDLLKPKPGDPDFARKQQVYNLALATGQEQSRLRLTDPAAALLVDKSAAELWRGVADGTPASAQAWANDALRRQAAIGVPADQQRILPVAVAKDMVKAVVADKEPVGKTAALTGLYGYAQRFGPNSGRVLLELQRAGLPPAEAAVINAVDGDPIVVGAYARALTQAPLVKLDAPTKAKLEAKVAAQLKPLVESYAGSQDGLAYSNALSFAVSTMARANMADDADVDAAARSAARNFLQRYAFDTRTGNRLPAAEAARKVMMVPGTTAENLNRTGEVLSSARMVAPPREATGEVAARIGSYRVLRDLVSNDGAGLSPVAGRGAALAPEDYRKRYATQVAHSGRWVSTGDDAGMMLMLPSPQGGLMPVLAADGKPVVRSWSDLYSRAGKP
ncbi:hypothetical protein [Caulobacter sp. BK020]|uniref:hypothetical protein n=1 Tax=Caulobacter sp. BK020 TaxID=2512117 RepID=UPI001051A75A|nr:hypothetical protein [Caulobacter sp. BK020]TCS14541.1 hypothetical protein EV278_107190 [Caulobacter sp. BK020]